MDYSRHQPEWQQVNFLMCFCCVRTLTRWVNLRKLIAWLPTPISNIGIVNIPCIGTMVILICLICSLDITLPTSTLNPLVLVVIRHGQQTRLGRFWIWTYMECPCNAYVPLRHFVIDPDTSIISNRHASISPFIAIPSTTGLRPLCRWRIQHVVLYSNGFCNIHVNC